MNNELYHYGVPGMKWGVRKAIPQNVKRGASNRSKQFKDTSANRSKQSKIIKGDSSDKNKMDSTDRYFDKTKKNATTKKAGYGMAVAGTVMKHIGQQQYNVYKNNSTSGRTAVINGLGYAGNALQTIGQVTVVGSKVKQYVDYREWRKS